MKYLVLVAIIFVYSVLGKFLQDHGIIIRPAYWALYGYIFGTVVTAAIIGNKI
jgi:hypothetical protein